MAKGKTQSAGGVMKIINNITDKLSDELKEKLEPGSKLSIAAACFSVYAFEELKTQLEGIDALRFIFTSPTFLAEQPEKAQREFYIPRLNREKTLYGSEFEIRLRNEFTQKAISRECAEWVRRKASFKSNVTSELMPGFMTVENAAPCAFAPVNGFTRADLGCERGGNMFSMINEIDAPESAAYLTLFDQLWADKRKLKDVTDQVLERITTAYRENSPEFLYFFALYNIFSDFLENISEDDLPNEANGFKESQVWNKLYTFQKDAVLAIGALSSVSARSSIRDLNASESSRHSSRGSGFDCSRAYRCSASSVLPCSMAVWIRYRCCYAEFSAFIRTAVSIPARPAPPAAASVCLPAVSDTAGPGRTVPRTWPPTRRAVPTGARPATPVAGGCPTWCPD